MIVTDSNYDRFQALQEAEAALHAILTTGQTLRVRHGLKMVEYGPVNVQELKAYVARLRGGRVTAVRIVSSKGF